MICQCLPLITKLQYSENEGKTEDVDIAINADAKNEDSTGTIWKYRVSDENNGDIYLIFITNSGIRTGNRKLVLRNAKGKDELIMFYKFGSGVVSLYEPSGALVGECNSAVGFRCLSIKVKYLFTDSTGDLLFKIVTEMHPYSDEHASFKLNIKNSNNAEIGSIKMGRQKNCCHIKLNVNSLSSDEKKWLIAIWATFMDYEILENELNTNNENDQEIPLKIL